MTSAADLLTLQDIDLRRDSLRALIADIESRLTETDELIAARQVLADSNKLLAGLRHAQAEIDDKLQDLDSRITPLETRLYNGSVRNPKELSDMQKELDSFKARRSGLDEQGLALLEQIESATAQVQAAESALATVEAGWQEDQAALLGEKAQAEDEVKRLQIDRDRWAQSMSPAVLGVYEKTRLMRQGRAVARIERTTCQGCRISLPTHVVQRVRAGGAIVQCPSCERILVGV